MRTSQQMQRGRSQAHWTYQTSTTKGERERCSSLCLYVVRMPSRVKCLKLTANAQNFAAKPAVAGANKAGISGCCSAGHKQRGSEGETSRLCSGQVKLRRQNSSLMGTR